MQKDYKKLREYGIFLDEEDYITDPAIDRDPAFKRRFDRIEIKEPKEDTVVEILEGTIPKLEETTKVQFGYQGEQQKEILSVLVKATGLKSQRFDDHVAYPDSSLLILKKAFAHAMVDNEKKVKLQQLMEAFESTNRINLQERYAISLRQIANEEKKGKPTTKIIQFPKKIN